MEIKQSRPPRALGGLEALGPWEASGPGLVFLVFLVFFVFLVSWETKKTKKTNPGLQILWRPGLFFFWFFRFLEPPVQ